MKRIVWLASYPKSGNTWLRLLFAAYHQTPRTKLNLSEVFLATRSDSRRVAFETLAGKSGLSDQEVDGYREAIQRSLAEELRPPVLVKTHNARVRRGNIPLIRDEFTLGAIYVVRNPLDIVDSVADHWGCSLADAIAMLADEQLMIGGNGDAMVRQYVQSWSEHVSSWIKTPAFPTHLVRYEDLHSATELTFRNVLTFLGWPLDEERIAHAINATEFAKLQKQETATAFAERSKNSTSGRFFRQGQAGRWIDLLTTQQVDQMIGCHGEVMRRLGYLNRADRIGALQTNPAESAMRVGRCVAIESIG